MGTPDLEDFEQKIHDLTHLQITLASILRIGNRRRVLDCFSPSVESKITAYMPVVYLTCDSLEQEGKTGV